jgi:hypothetical protein
MNHQIVSHEEWMAARRALPTKEKEFTRLGDEMSRQVRELWSVPPPQALPLRALPIQGPAPPHPP